MDETDREISRPDEAMPAPPESSRGRQNTFFAWMDMAPAAAIAVATVFAATVLGLEIDRFVHLPNISLLFLLAVLASAAFAGYVSAFMSAALSTLAYNFFFIPPLHTLTIAEPHELFALFAFLAAALLTGSLASRIRQQAEAAIVRARATQALYDFAGKLSGTAKAEDVLWAAVTQLQRGVSRNIVLLTPEDGTLGIAAAWPPDTELGLADLTAARWAYDKQEISGRGTGTLSACPFQFRPLLSPHGVVGVCGIHIGHVELDTGAERSLTAILDQTAVAIDRARLSQETLDQAARLESERHRAALLSSLSHDLRTPLASITGAITSLRLLGERMTPESRDDLLQSIEEESARLNRFVTNLLDMTRIEAGMLETKREWIDAGDVVRASVDRARKYFPTRSIEMGIAANLPLIKGDSALLGQVLFNLLDNAAKYGGEEPINVHARPDGDDVLLTVTDLGRGIPPQDLERVFEKFYRRGKADGRTPGTGLGLAIARGFVESMGGEIRAESPTLKRRGTRMVLRFPVGKMATRGKTQ